MKLLITVVTALISLNALASDLQIQIYRNSLTPKSASLDSRHDLVKLMSRTPHRQLNPEGKVSEYEGVPLKQLLKLSRKDRDLLIHFIGVDGYISTVPAEVLLKTDAILAIKENGNSLAERSGGIQVVYPTDGAHGVEDRYAKKAAFWCWYVRSIVVGDLPNSLKLGKRNSVPLKSQTSFKFEPPSVFQFNKVACPETFSLPLSAVSKANEVTLHYLSGATKKIDPKTYNLVFSPGRAALPTICGGPFVVAKTDKSAMPNTPVLAKNLETSVVTIEESQ